jgi:acyl-coenzyme A synthetase/AMP-(fatty) acid ligase
VVNLVNSDIDEFRLTPSDRVAQGSSAAYDSSVEELWLAWGSGAAAVVMDEDAARLGPDLIPWLQHERVTVLCPPPTLLRTTGCERPWEALPELRLLYVGGEALPQDVADRWGRGRILVNGYGPTECTVTSVRGPICPGDPITIGLPVCGFTAWVLDESLQSVPEGAEGELCLSGVGLARGYRNLPAVTAEKFPQIPGLGRI